MSWFIKVSAGLLFAKEKPKEVLIYVKLLPIEEYISQRKPMVCGFVIRVKDNSRKFVARRKI